MKKGLFLIPVFAGMLMLAACQEEQSEESAELPAETTTTEAVTTTAAATTTTETTTVTTTTTVDYQIAEKARLDVDLASVRSTSCTLTLTNDGEEQLHYEAEFRIIDAATDRELAKHTAEFEYPTKPGVLAPGEETSISVDWTELYGNLPDGVYIFEQLLEMPAAEDADDGDADDETADSENAETADAESRCRIVARAEFEIDSEGFVPRLTIDPATVTPEGVVLIVKNSLDAARDYGLVYRLYDESGSNRVQLLREIDTDAKLGKNYHMEPGESIELKYKWTDVYGSLLEGSYAIEIDLLAEGAESAESYRAAFVIE